MNTQTPASHLNDPESSYEAEQHMNASGKRQAQQKTTLEAVRHHAGKTSAELAAATGLDRAMLARRLPELEPQYVSKGVKVKCKINNTQAVTWWPVMKLV